MSTGSPPPRSPFFFFRPISHQRACSQANYHLIRGGVGCGSQSPTIIERRLWDTGINATSFTWFEIEKLQSYSILYSYVHLNVPINLKGVLWRYLYVSDSLLCSKHITFTGLTVICKHADYHECPCELF